MPRCSTPLPFLEPREITIETGQQQDIEVEFDLADSSAPVTGFEIRSASFHQEEEAWNYLFRIEDKMDEEDEDATADEPDTEEEQPEPVTEEDTTR